MRSLYGAIVNYKLYYMEKSKGLGDSIEKFTTFTGIKSFTQFLTSNSVLGKKDCGCNKRKESLNKKFPYNNK